VPLFRRRPDLSVVVICYDMQRELPRTLRSLSSEYQRGVDAIDYEILVVDNASPVPVSPEAARAIDPRIRVHRINDGSPSPAGAANLGVAMTTGRVVALILDGARMVTPGTLASGLRAMATHDRAVVTPLAWHLGPAHQSVSIRDGYGKAVEDELLDGIDWPSDGYRLFEVSALAGANKEGFFGNVNESCCLFVSRDLWAESGGLDERFDQPAGGYVSLDLFTRLVTLPGTELIVLLGEGSFHQVHGGASTSPGSSGKAWAEHYEKVRGHRYQRPTVETTYFGRMPATARKWILPNS
jgi:glycosyltransferase involved in cell wall biosynthesis